MQIKYEPGDRVASFVIRHALGHGGMSDVFLAFDESEQREVVLKFPHADLLADAKSHEHFTREVKIGRLLDHPNIQKLYELAGEPREPFMVLEYVPGTTLRDVLQSDESGLRPMQLAERVDRALRLGSQIAHALAYAHANHVAHRDLKPENVIVTADGQAKVMDFGVAYIEGARRVTWGALSSQVGTPDYMAPEQIRGTRGDQRTDIYGVGMILYELIALRLPYTGDNALSIMSQHVNEDAPPIRSFCKSVPANVEEIVMKAIRRVEADRWQSMEVFAAALEHPESVDAAALKQERESVAKNSAGQAGIALEIGMPIWKLALIVLTIFAVIIGIAVVGTVLRGSTVGSARP